MDPTSEALMRSSIHDMANTLSGIRGILELSDPLAPLSPRDRARLEAILAEGIVTLERARHLAMESLPQAMTEPGPDWRRHLEVLLEPLSVIFRCRIEICFEGSQADDRWPGDLARGYALALTRQILPYVQGGSMRILCHANAQHLLIRWQPVSHIPEGLQTRDDQRSRDISALWATRTGKALGACVTCEDGALLVSIPRT